MFSIIDNYEYTVANITTAGTIIGVSNIETSMVNILYGATGILQNLHGICFNCLYSWVIALAPSTFEDVFEIINLLTNLLFGAGPIWQNTLAAL